MLKSLNWNLERVKPGDGASPIKKQVSEMMLQMDEKRTELANRNNTNEISEIIEMIWYVQSLYTKVFEMDEYIICQSSINVNDSEAQILSEQSTQMNARLDTLLLTFRQYLATISEDGWHKLIQQPDIQGIKTFLMEQRQRVQEQLHPELEKVIHSLSINGFNGWENHYVQEYANLTVPVHHESGTENMTFDAAFMRMIFSPEHTIRKTIAQSITEVSRENEERFASIFNHFAGYRIELHRLRGWSNPLKEMLEQNRINEASVNSMIQTLHQYKYVLHMFLKRKAELNNVEKLSWYDIYSPTFASATPLTYDEAAAIVIRQFYNYSDKLGEFAEKAFKEEWIDAEPSDSKRPGAFSASFPNSKESRILLSFTGSYQDVVTLAHELGHAYHNSILHENPGFAQQTGTALAETASTFAENLVLDAAIDSAETEADQLSLLEMKIINGLKYIAYIPATFEFEQQFYQKRSNRKLSAAELDDLMEKTERDWFHDALEDVNTHGWMAIPHFFDTQKTFFTISYTIGYLFSNGIYSLYLSNKAAYSERYDQLLKSSGNQTMENLGSEFLNHDLNSQSFWETAIQPLEEAIHTYLEKTKAYL